MRDGFRFGDVAPNVPHVAETLTCHITERNEAAMWVRVDLWSGTKRIASFIAPRHDVLSVANLMRDVATTTPRVDDRANLLRVFREEDDPNGG